MSYALISASIAEHEKSNTLYSDLEIQLNLFKRCVVSMKTAILVLNAGSSSLKFSLFEAKPGAIGERLAHGAVTGIGGRQSEFQISVFHELNKKIAGLSSTGLVTGGHEQALHLILNWLDTQVSEVRLIAAAHRLVHGGSIFRRPIRVDDVATLAQLKSLIPLAPLHQPHALHAIETLLRQYPDLPQVACFDTAFHATMPWQEQRYALPLGLHEQGLRRYGFHGLSYEYVVSVLPAHLGAMANGKVVIAHLGHGVSLCAVENRKSVATTMGFTPLDGLPMATRSGALDPAAVLYLFAQGMTADAISDLLHNKSGLLGLSGISSDMRILLESQEPDAISAVEYFCYRISREIGSLAAALGGVDAVIFTGGIGEKASAVRDKVCDACAWLGLDIDAHANQDNAVKISTNRSRVSVLVIPTDEELVIARHAFGVIFP